MLSFELIQKTKCGERVSGDSAISFSIGTDKHIFMICDGMGSGREARLQSELALNALKDFIEHGDDLHTALKRTSELVFRKNADCFVTADVLILDLTLMQARLIKAGAAPTLFMSGGKTRLFATSSLPLGLLFETRADEFLFEILPESRILLFSDGLLSEDGTDDVTAFYIRIGAV